ncbi:MAG TPA: hypothetical protein VL053_00725 [Arachidicoccus sp.]|nr:hypothetical protein [Arachidicoccus sp.]
MDHIITATNAYDQQYHIPPVALLGVYNKETSLHNSVNAQGLTGECFKVPNRSQFATSLFLSWL